jgi:hypothetical protein
MTDAVEALSVGVGSARVFPRLTLSAVTLAGEILCLQGLWPAQLDAVSW